MDNKKETIIDAAKLIIDKYSEVFRRLETI